MTYEQWLVVALIVVCVLLAYQNWRMLRIMNEHNETIEETIELVSALADKLSETVKQRDWSAELAVYWFSKYLNIVQQWRP